MLLPTYSLLQRASEAQDDPKLSPRTMLRPVHHRITNLINKNLRNAALRGSSVPIPRLSLNSRTLSSSAHLSDKPLPPRLKLDEADITLSYVKGTGPGGQKIVFLPLPIIIRLPSTIPG